MKINEIVLKYANELPGFELVGYQEVGIPIYQRRIHILALVQKTLPVVQEFILNFYSKGLTLTDIKKILGIDGDVVESEWIELLQKDYINYINKKITTTGEEYLKSYKIDKFDKIEFAICIDSITGDISKINNNLMITKTIKERGIRSIKSNIPKPAFENLEFKDVKRVFNQYKKEGDKELFNGDMLDIAHIEGNTTKYRRVNILLFKNSENNIRIMAYDGFNRLEKYDERLIHMEDKGISLLKYEFADFWTSDTVKKIKTVINEKELSPIFHREINSKFESYMSATQLDIILPLVSQCHINDEFIENLYSILKHGGKIRIILAGKDFLNEYQKKTYFKLRQIMKKYKCLTVLQIPEYANKLIIDKKTGKTLVSIYEKVDINLPMSKYGVIEKVFEVSEDETGNISTIINELINSYQIDYRVIGTKLELKNLMIKLQNLIYDADGYMNGSDNIGWIDSDEIPEITQFIEVPLATDENKFRNFINSINKSLIESLENNSKRRGMNNYFWNDFASRYPELQHILEKIKVYRNRCDHLDLNAINKEKYYKFLKEDLNGNMPEVLESGYYILQCKILTELKEAILKTIKLLK